MQRAREPRDFARRSVAMERALAGGFVEHASRLAQFLRGALGVRALDRLGGLFHGAVHAGFYRTIAVAPFEALAMALLG